MAPNSRSDRPRRPTPLSKPHTSPVAGPSKVQKKSSIEIGHVPSRVASIHRVNSVIASRAGSIYNYDSSFDQHGPVQVDMEILSGQIHDTIRAGHNELRNRIDKEGDDENLEGMPAHLLQTPPSSPKPLAESPPPTPQTKARQERFKNMTYPDLLKTNEDLHRQLQDLDSIRTLWRNNRSEYMGRLTKIKGINKTISNLEGYRHAVRYARVGVGVDMANKHCAMQLKLQIENRQREINWLVENRELMKKILKQFRHLAEETGQSTEKAGDSEQAAIRTAQASKEFLYAATKDVTKLRWYREKGLIYWLEPAHQDLMSHWRRLQKQREDADEDIEYCKGKIQEIKSRLTALDKHTLMEDARIQNEIDRLQKQNTPTSKADAEIRRNERYTKRLEEDRQWAQERDHLRSYNVKLDDSKLFIRAWTDEQDRLGLVMEQITDIMKALKKTPDLMQHHSALINDLYRSCYIIHCRFILEKRLRITYKSNLLSRDQLGKIHRLINNHYAYFIDNDRARRWQTRESTLDDEAISYECERLQNEFEAFEKLEEQVQTIAEGRGPSFIPEPRPVSNESSLSRNGSNRHRVQRTLPGNDIYAGSLMSDATARYLLSQKPKLLNARGEQEQYSITWVDLLFQTFTSPDVFPVFFQFYGDGVTNVTPDDLYTILNEIAAEKVPRNIFEAFLKYCEHFGELFRKNKKSNGLIVTTAGWDYCREHGVWGLPRKITPAQLMKPDGINHVEFLMMDYVAKNGLLGRKTKFYRDTVLDWLNVHLGVRITMDVLKGYLDYWTLIGTFFIYSDPNELSKSHSKQRIHCIDNGWDPKLYSRRLRVESFIPTSSKSQILKKFQTIRGDLSNRDLRAFYRLHKERGEKVMSTTLFNYVYGTKSQRTEGLNWSISKQEFELFLRWEDNNPQWYKFILYYNDEVDFVEEAGVLR